MTLLLAVMWLFVGLMFGICLGAKLAEYYWITLPKKTACRLCHWMRGSGHAPQCSLWRPKPGELQTLAEEYAAEMAGKR